MDLSHGSFTKMEAHLSQACFCLSRRIAILPFHGRWLLSSVCMHFNETNKAPVQMLQLLATQHAPEQLPGGVREPMERKASKAAHEDPQDVGQAATCGDQHLTLTSVSLKTESNGRDRRTSLGSFPSDTRPLPCISVSWIAILGWPVRGAANYDHKPRSQCRIEAKFLPQRPAICVALKTTSYWEGPTQSKISKALQGLLPAWQGCI